jgi:ADP-ribose pyrophosphatase YjhB (NUDIX family)
VAKLLTNGYILEGNKLLLGMKKTGSGQGKWNGFGGKVKEGETIEEAAAREFEEECEIKVLKSEQFGKITFVWNCKPDELEVHFYRILEYMGEPKETDEMKPQWFDVEKIPYEAMWKDDPYWMPLFLKGKKFEGKILFNEKDEVMKAEIKEVNEF